MNTQLSTAETIVEERFGPHAVVVQVSRLRFELWLPARGQSINFIRCVATYPSVAALIAALTKAGAV